MRLSCILASLIAILVLSRNIAHDNHGSDDESQTLIKACGTHHPTDEEIALTNGAIESWNTSPQARRMPIHTTVPTYFHSITDDLIGVITDSEIEESINVLNAVFAGKFIFQLEKVTITNNKQWYHNRRYENQMKRQLREGECNALNIYSTSGHGVAGYATFPSLCSAGHKIYDGVVINSRTKPGGDLFL